MRGKVGEREEGGREKWHKVKMCEVWKKPEKIRRIFRPLLQTIEYYDSQGGRNSACMKVHVCMCVPDTCACTCTGCVFCMCCVLCLCLCCVPQLTLSTLSIRG